MLIRKIYYLLSPNLRRLARRIYFFPSDMFDALFKKKLSLVPPKGLIFIGPGDFVLIGDTFLHQLKQLCALQPTDKVLDVGCGIGRIARPLTKYLNANGAYYGFDIVKEGIDWCRKNYIAYKNFNFKWIPLKNDLYNLSTETEASTFVFPYPNYFFNVVVLTSVFTHMQQKEVQQYINEIGRVLKTGGYCFCTFFMITPASDALLLKSKTPFFPYRYDGFFLHDEKVKDANIAYKYDVVKAMVHNAGLTIQSFNAGWWPGTPENESLSYQDVLIMRK